MIKNRTFHRISALSRIILTVAICFACTTPEPVLKDEFKDYFLIGTAANSRQILGIDSLSHALIVKHFNSLTGENALKWDSVHLKPGVYDFKIADSLVSLCMRNNIFLVGHALVWHQQVPKWVFEDTLGNAVSRDTLLQRMKDHIFTVVGRYKGKVQGWDVVNEAINDTGGLRKTKWLEIIGEDYIQKAFEYAREADPDAELYYNDYNIERPGRREGTIRLVKDLQSKGVKVDGIGIQGHYHLDTPTLGMIDTSIQLFGDLGVKVMFTELDINVLPRPEGMDGAELSQNYDFQKKFNPYSEGLTDSMQMVLANRYADLFKIFVKHKDVVSRVTFWGLHDGQSWLNNWPIKGRSNYPLLFDRNFMPKPAFYAVIKTVE